MPKNAGQLSRRKNMQPEQFAYRQIEEHEAVIHQHWEAEMLTDEQQQQHFEQRQFLYKQTELSKNQNDKALNKAKTADEIVKLCENRRKKAVSADKKKLRNDKARHGFYKVVMAGVKLGRKISGSDKEEKNTRENPFSLEEGLLDKFTALDMLKKEADDMGLPPEYFEERYGELYRAVSAQYHESSASLRTIADMYVEESPVERTEEEKEAEKQRLYDSLMEKEKFIMTYSGNERSNVEGGTKPNAIRTAKDGSRWLVKTNHSCIGAAAPNASIMTVAGYKIQQLVHPDTAIEAFETKSARQGTVSMQRMADNVLSASKGEVVDLFRFSRTPEAMTDAELEEIESLSPQLLREHTTDWLLANFDTKGENFIISRGRTPEEKIIRGIDKEAGGRAILDEGAQHMSKSYRKFDQDTVYNQLFRKFADGSMDLDLHAVEAQVLRVEQCTDNQYMEIFRDYIQRQKQDRPDDADKIKENLLKRKQNLRVEYRRFFTELVHERIANTPDEDYKQILADRYLGGMQKGTFIFRSDTAEGMKAEREAQAAQKEANAAILEEKVKKADAADEKKYNRRHALYDFSKGFVMGFKKMLKAVGIVKIKNESRVTLSRAGDLQYDVLTEKEKEKYTETMLRRMQQTREEMRDKAPDAPVVLEMAESMEVRLGGTKPMSQYVAQDGSRWLAKQAVDCMGYKKVSGALLTAIGSGVQKLVDEDTAVEAFMGRTKEHGLVSFQRRLRNVEGDVRNDAGEIVKEKLDLFKFSKHPELATRETVREVEEIMPQILREHVTDWLLCNFDTKGENFVITRENPDAPRVLHGIDKEAAFNHIRKPDAQHMSTTFKPHANNTLYNVVFEKFANAEMDFDLREVIPYVEKVTAMSAEQYMSTFKAYFDYLDKNKKPQEVETIKGAIQARWENLREEYIDFFTQLIERRCEKIHPDEATALRKKYYDTVTHRFRFTLPMPQLDE